MIEINSVEFIEVRQSIRFHSDILEIFRNIRFCVPELILFSSYLTDGEAVT